MSKTKQSIKYRKNKAIKLAARVIKLYDHTRIYEYFASFNFQTNNQDVQRLVTSIREQKTEYPSISHDCYHTIVESLPNGEAKEKLDLHLEQTLEIQRLRVMYNLVQSSEKKIEQVIVSTAKLLFRCLGGDRAKLIDDIEHDDGKHHRISLETLETFRHLGADLPASVFEMLPILLIYSIPKFIKEPPYAWFKSGANFQDFKFIRLLQNYASNPAMPSGVTLVYNFKLNQHLYMTLPMVVTKCTVDFDIRQDQVFSVHHTLQLMPSSLKRLGKIVTNACGTDKMMFNHECVCNLASIQRLMDRGVIVDAFLVPISASLKQKFWFEETASSANDQYHPEYLAQLKDTIINASKLILDVVNIIVSDYYASSSNMTLSSMDAEMILGMHFSPPPTHLLKLYYL